MRIGLLVLFMLLAGLTRAQDLDCDPSPTVRPPVDWINESAVTQRMAEQRATVRQVPNDEAARQALAELTVQLALAAEEADARERAEDAARFEELIRTELADTLWRVGYMAKNGNAGAMTANGFVYRTGLGGETNAEAACRWYRQAADAGDKYGLYRASLCTVRTDPEASVAYMQRAARHGHAAAQEAVGQVCLNRDAPEAAECAALWLEQAARQGRVQAAAYTGWLYFTGEGVERDPARAFQHYCAAARAGNPFAQNNLAEFYEQGWAGQAEDPVAAAAWYRRAADQGFPPAQANLGRLYATGSGVESSPIQARYWLEQAAAQGFEPAVRYLHAWQAELNP